jgi:acyl carrier protein
MNPLLKLQAIFREFFDEPTLVITADTSPAVLPDWDSVAQVHIVLAVEEAFEIRFTTDEVAKIHSVADILRVIDSRI